MTTASQLIWINAERPLPKWRPESIKGVCATCAAPIAEGVPTTAVNNPTFSQHADFWRYGTHVCPACAWLYGAGKGRPGNVLAYGDRLEYLVISTSSVVVNKRPWLHVLPDLLTLPLDAEVVGVLTTDVKPRVWPRMVLSTVGAPTLYVHAAEYDISAPVTLDVQRWLTLAQTIGKALDIGYTKKSVQHTLTRDYPRFIKNLEVSRELEDTFAPVRHTPEFVPALIIAQKGESFEPSRELARKLDPTADTRGSSNETQSGLF